MEFAQRVVQHACLGSDFVVRFDVAAEKARETKGGTSAMQDSKLPVAGLLAVIAAVVAALFWTHVPLNPGRPAQDRIAEHHQRAVQDIDARLWEDPFVVVARHERSTSKEAGPEQGSVSRSASGVCLDLVGAGKSPLDLLVLGVMLSNAPYVDASENRSRMRYALQSALGVAHFVPQDAQHLGYLSYDIRSTDLTLKVPFEVLRRKSGQQPQGSSSASAPADRDFKALVLWLEEEALSQPIGGKATPAGNVADLVDSIRSACRTVVQDKGGRQYSGAGDAAKDTGATLRIEAAILGPSGSDTLRAIVHEARSWPSGATCARAESDACSELEKVQRLHIYSPFATASGRYLLQIGDEPYKPCGTDSKTWLRKDWDAASRGSGSVLHDYFAPCGVSFYSTIATDEELASELVTELRKRGLKALGTAEQDFSVALVSEWDTYYGRMLPKALMRAIGMEEACEDDPAERERRPESCRVLRYAYLRGLDGQIPSDASAKDQTQKSAKAEEQKAAAQERAEGAQQFDYLRRLSQRIYDDSRRGQATVAGLKDSFRRAPRGGIRAIGVLGSDTYDKLAVLRALRRGFPQALFFTTDLDARLLDPAQSDWTRNLLVASGFGLQLAPCAQKWIPPFRGSYQTSAYFSARLALYNAFSDDPQKHAGVLCPEYADGDSGTFQDAPTRERPIACTLAAAATGMVCPPEAHDPVRASQCVIDAWMLRPRMYELSRTGAWDLTGVPEGCAARAYGVQPPARAFVPSGSDLAIGVALSALLIVGAVLVRPVRRTLLNAGVCLRPAITGGPGTASTRALLAVLAAVFAVLVVLMIRAYLEARTGVGEPVLWSEGISVWPSELVRALALVLAAVFLLAACGAVNKSTQAVADEFHLTEASVSFPWWQRFVGRLPVPADATGVPLLWSQYVQLSSPRRVFWRALAWTILYLVIAAVLMSLWGRPGVPARGEIVVWLDRYLVLLVVPAFLLLLFYVADSTRLCERFSEAVSRPSELTSWPDTLLAERGGECWIGPGASDARWQTEASKAASDESEVGRRQKRIAESVLDAWLDARIVAERTKAITPLIYFPFVILALIVVARWDAFDNWDMPLGLIVVLAISFSVCCFSAWFLQRTANRVRNRCIAQLQRCLLARKGDKTDWLPTASQIEQLTDQIRQLREGAFVPFLEQPFFRAALLPFASAGGLQAIQMLGLLN